ncbi:MAG TPA: hypothetical protein IAC12_03620 [Candidatus Aphodovivens avistercoris]|nr:hypothetical protein [Candidatus Aphodovivens avistercoris]
MPRKRRKRRRAWGSITEVDPGRRYVLRWVENTPQGRKRRSRTFRGTYREADLELSRLQVEHADGGDRPVPTVGKAYAMWFEPWMERRVAEGKAKEGTHRAYASAWAKAVEPRWGRVPVDSIQPAEVQEWLLGLSAGAAAHAVVVLRKVLDFAVRFEAIPVNKMRLPYEMPTRKTHVRRSDVYGLAEAEKVLGRLRGEAVEAPYILACFGGARTGESLGVRASEVGRAESHGIACAIVPIVRRMADKGDLPLPDGDLKNRQSERTLVIPEPYGTRLLEIAEERIAAGVEWLADRGDGLPMSRGRLLFRWRSAMGREGVPFANLRNSWRTFAQFDWGVEPDVLEILMGHVIPTVTGRHYLRPGVDDLVSAVASAVASSRVR